MGDGGNDVGMIQCANVGIGIIGKEGMQAALASDFSISQFKHIQNLILWHGRNAYKKSAILSQFVIHRGLIISAIQMIFCTLFYFVTIMIYNGWLMLGYGHLLSRPPWHFPHAQLVNAPPPTAPLRTARIPTMTLRTMTLHAMTLHVMTLYVTTLRTMTLHAMTLRTMTLRTMTLHTAIKVCDNLHLPAGLLPDLR